MWLGLAVPVRRWGHVVPMSPAAMTHTAGTFVPKGPSNESSLNPLLLRPSSPSMFDVGCSMFDVHPPARYVACGDHVGAAGPRRPTSVKLGAGRSKEGLDQDDPASVPGMGMDLSYEKK